jgi:hypothetical protein
MMLYQVADSTQMVMDIPGMGAAPVEASSRVTADLTFAQENGALSVTATITDVAGRFTSPGGPGQTIGPGDKPAPATVRIARNGAVSNIQLPTFSAALAQVTTPMQLFHSFFVRLPGRAVERGAAWTDTVRFSEEQAGLTTNVLLITRSTWTRDTTVAGRQLALIESQTTSRFELSGASQGVEIRQTLEGASQARALWDGNAHTLVERTEQGTASGTADLPGFDMRGIPVRAQSRQTLRRIPR